MFEKYNDLLTVGELCVILRACPCKVYRLINNAEIPASKSGRMWLIPKSGVVEYVNRNMTIDINNKSDS